MNIKPNLSFARIVTKIHLESSPVLLSWPAEGPPCGWWHSTAPSGFRRSAGSPATPSSASVPGPPNILQIKSIVII